MRFCAAKGGGRRMSWEINNSSNALIVVDAKGIIRQINSVAEHLFGFKSGELVNQFIGQIVYFSNIENKKKFLHQFLGGNKEKDHQKGVKKSGEFFPIDVFVVPVQEKLFACIVKDDIGQSFHEQFEKMGNTILRKVIRGEELKDFVEFILNQIQEIFGLQLLWFGEYNSNEKNVHVLCVKGSMSKTIESNAIYTSTDKLIHPSVRACIKKKMVKEKVFDIKKNACYLISIPILLKNESIGVLTFLVLKSPNQHFVIEGLENIATRLGLILQIAQEQNALRLLRMAISCTMNAVFIANVQGKIIWANEAFVRLSGYTAKAIIGKDIDFLSKETESCDIYKTIFPKIKEGLPWKGEIIGKRKNKTLFAAEQILTPMRYYKSDVTHYVSIYNELTEKKDAQQAIFHLSNYDQLTGLPNRDLFQEQLAQILSESKQINEKIAIVLMDIVGFNRVNDMLGHSVGDQILKNVAKRIKSCVSVKDVVARIGSDEFGIILRELPHPEEAGKIVHQIIKNLQRNMKIGKDVLELGCNAGISMFPSDAKDVGKLINYADMVLFKAKRTGAQSYLFFSPELNTEIEERFKLEQEMRKALIHKEFFLNFQPQIDLKTGRIAGWEALVRWRHPKKGLIPPTVFIPIAEDTGLIVVLGMLILEEALKQLKDWNKQGYKDITMAVNVSSVQFEGENLSKEVKRLIKKYHVKPGTLELELTESVIMKDAAKAADILKTFANNGVHLSIDDFGTGYSSLNYIKTFPFNKLKIDRSFIKNVLEKSEDLAIVKAIISLGHILELDVIAEGVENIEQLELLKKLECDFIQGFYSGRPMNAQTATALLAKRNNELK